MNVVNVMQCTFGGASLYDTARTASDQLIAASVHTSLGEGMFGRSICRYVRP